MNFIKHIIKKHLVLILSISFLIVFATTIHVFATDAWPYAPGATLNPGCDPITDANCTVTTGWGLTGTASTVDGTNFIGTTDNIPLNFRVNNQKAGRIDPTLFNTFFGYQAGNSNTTGNYNTANGYQALYFNTTGTNNVANGSGALYSNTIGVGNTASGFWALYINTEGSNNTANGDSALYSNTTGNYNTALGEFAGFSSIGSGNVFLGYQAGYSGTGSNTLYIANTNTTTPLIYGDFGTGAGDGALTINGTIKITGGIPGVGKVLTSDADGLATWETPAAGGASIVQEITVNLNANQIKTASSVPIDTGISVGAGEAIEVISASANLIIGETPFGATGASLSLITNTAPSQQALISNFINSASNTFRRFTVSSALTIQLISGEGLFIKANADSNVGDGTIDVYIAYRIITL